MKFKAVNPDRRSLPRPLGILALLLSLAMTGLGAQEAPSHEYSADGETTIETVNGLRVITLRSNVFVRQEDIELTGDVAVLEYDRNNQLQQVRLTGSPANFEQKGSDESGSVTGFSDTINYYAGSEPVVEFIGNASFSQPGTSLRCAEIRHTIATGATSGQACSGSLSPQAN